MKIIKNIVVLIVSSLSLLACYSDNSNTSLNAPEVITIEGLEENYSIVSMSETLKITPIAKSNFDGELTYSWSYYETNVQGYAPVIIPIHNEQVLEQTFALTPKTWELILTVKNEATGYAHIATTSLEITTPYTKGWYVIKDDNNSITDLDMYKVVDGLIPEKGTPSVENILKFTGQEQMKGKAINSANATNFQLLNAEGRYANTNVLIAVSNNDIRVLKVEDMSGHRDLSNISYDDWSASEMGPVTLFGRAQTVVRSNQFYAIGTMTPNTGKFGMPKTLGGAYDYSLSQYIVNGGYSSTILFDNTTSSFIAAGYYGDIEYGSTAAEGEIEARDNNLSVLYMANCASQMAGLFKNKTTNKLMILQGNLANSMKIEVKAEIAADSKINGAEKFAMSQDEQYLYFVASDGNIYSRSFVNPVAQEDLEFTTPAGEEILFVTNYKYSKYNTPIDENYLIVATVKGSGDSAQYTIRFFNKLGGRFDGEIEELRLTGNGYPRDILCVYV